VGAEPSGKVGKSLSRPVTVSPKLVNQTANTNAVRDTGSYKPVGQLPAAKNTIDTGSYKPVGKVPAPKRVSDTGWYGTITSKSPSSRSEPAQMKGASATPVKPISSPTPAKNVSAQFKPPSSVTQRVNPSTVLSAQLTVGGGKGPASSTRVGAQWKCSSCGTALGPQSVIQGTGVILEGKLTCVDCIKYNAKKRAENLEIRPRVIVVTTSVLVVTFGIAAVFAPGPACVLILALGVLAVLAGVLGFTLSRTARLSAIAAGLAAMLLSSWGIVALRSHTETNAAVAVTNSNVAEFDRDLNTGHIAEAMRKIKVIQQNVRSNSAEQRLIDELKGRMDAWVRKNFGELTSQERSTLFLLFGEFGATTDNSAQKFRSLKISEGAISLTMAVSPKDIAARSDPANEEEPKSDLKGHADSKVSIPALDNASAVALYFVRNMADVTSFELKIVTAYPSGVTQDFRTIKIDSQAIGEYKKGNPVPFQQALSESVVSK
jgi:hypothetical protein